MKTSSAAPRSTEESRAALHERIESDFRYHSPTPEQLPKYAEIRDTARELAHRLVDLVPPGRELSTALTKLEEAVMAANAGIAPQGCDRCELWFPAGLNEHGLCAECAEIETEKL